MRAQLTAAPVPAPPPPPHFLLVSPSLAARLYAPRPAPPRTRPFPETPTSASPHLQVPQWRDDGMQGHMVVGADTTSTSIRTSTGSLRAARSNRPERRHARPDITILNRMDSEYLNAGPVPLPVLPSRSLSPAGLCLYRARVVPVSTSTNFAGRCRGLRPWGAYALPPATHDCLHAGLAALAPPGPRRMDGGEAEEAEVARGWRAPWCPPGGAFAQQDRLHAGLVRAPRPRRSSRALPACRRTPPGPRRMDGGEASHMMPSGTGSRICGGVTLADAPHRAGRADPSRALAALVRRRVQGGWMAGRRRRRRRRRRAT
ncbi:hypothetical protein B0H16DRAFT_1022395 [Mycena metata]|uniref:Uncharacterized protein n=1 Tax=Mycena metata TaxID=1033252 RepID=A0AAD7N1R6_9AGAR|nr:hypothetical protein B0H16DRAFT_1022395 [Mycena metata]